MKKPGRTCICDEVVVSHSDGRDDVHAAGTPPARLKGSRGIPRLLGLLATLKSHAKPTHSRSRSRRTKQCRPAATDVAACKLQSATCHGQEAFHHSYKRPPPLSNSKTHRCSSIRALSRALSGLPPPPQPRMPQPIAIRCRSGSSSSHSPEGDSFGCQAARAAQEGSSPRPGNGGQAVTASVAC